MRMQIGGNNGQGSKKEGIVVRVTGFVEQGSQVGVSGKNALTGEEVTVWLTDTGACAENKRRKTLKNLRDSFKMGPNRYKLEAGGLVHFKGCFAKKDSPNNYISTWANVLGYNAQAVKDYVAYIKNCFVNVVEPRDGDTWPPFGYVTSFQSRYIISENIQDLESQIAEVRTEINNCTLLVRFLDQYGRVIGFKNIDSTKRYNKEKGCEFTPDEYGVNCVALIEDQLSNYNDVAAVNILVGKTWSISREGLLAEGNNKLKYWTWIAEHFYKDTREGDNTYRDFFCRDAFGKLSDPLESQIFMNNLHFPGTDEGCYTADPVLLGGLTYAGQAAEPPKAETSTQSKSVEKPGAEGRAVEEPPKVESQTPRVKDETLKVKPQAQESAEEPMEEGWEIDPEGRVVEESTNIEPQSLNGQAEVPEAKNPVPPVGYMNFEQALASGAF